MIVVVETGKDFQVTPVRVAMKEKVVHWNLLGRIRV